MSEHIIQLLVTERDRLDRAIEALQPVDKYDDPIMPDWVKPEAKVAPAPKKTRFSAATRRRMAEGQRKRYAAIRAAAAESPAPKKRTMSAEGRQRIIDATKARWAKINAAKAQAAAPKKRTKSVILAEAIAPKEDQEFKARMSAAMKKAWSKRRAAAKNKKAA